MIVQMLERPRHEAVGEDGAPGQRRPHGDRRVETLRPSWAEGRSTRLTPRVETRIGNASGIQQIVGFARVAPTWIGSSRRRRPLYAVLQLSPRTHVSSLDASSQMGNDDDVVLAAHGLGRVHPFGRHRHHEHDADQRHQRIREIGLRKSLGARRRDITKQFLLEAIMLCVAGGAFGILFGFLAAFGLGQVIGAVQAGMTVTRCSRRAWCPAPVAVCVLIGAVFGYYPVAAPPSSTWWSPCATSRSAMSALPPWRRRGFSLSSWSERRSRRISSGASGERRGRLLAGSLDFGLRSG